MGQAWAANDDRQRVLDATDIVQVVSSHLALRPRGREFVALCPFHDDSNPSMYVVPRKQIFHCFSCGAGGNALDFVMRFHGMGFREALRQLADQAGVALTPSKRAGAGVGPAEGETGRDEIARANATALDFFRTILAHPEHGREARQVLAARGVTPEAAEEFRIGAAPDRWDGLAATIQKLGLDARQFVGAGLLKERETGGHYDAMRHRIVFPILDQVGRPIAFGGRKLREEDEPKYLNSPETALFDKSSTLYGMHAAGRAIVKEGCAIIVEGYTDVIACHQAGVKHAVGTLGTALTPRHAGALKRLCSGVTLVFDSDEAGRRAADRAVEVFFAEPVDVRIAVLPGAKDPAELMQQEGGRRVFDESVAGAVDALDYRYARLAERLEGAGVSARAAAVEADVARLVEMGLTRVAPIRRRMIVQRLARVLGIEERAVSEAVARAAGEREGRGPARRERAAQAGAGKAKLTAAEHALGCLLAEPALWPGLGAEERAMLAPESLEDEESREVARVLLARLESGQEASLGQVVGAMESAGARERATAAAFEAEHICGGDQGLLDRRLRECLVQERRNRERRGSTWAQGAPSMSAAGAGGSDLLSEVKPVNESEASSRGAGDEGVSRLEARFAQRRKSIELTGGDPLTLPRPAGLEGLGCRSVARERAGAE